MIDDDRYDCDFSLEEQAEASKKHFEDLEDECCQSHDKYIKLSDLQKFPIRLDHYDEVNGNLKYVFGIENVIEYAECLPGYYLDNILSELEVLHDLVNESQKLAVSQAIEIVKRNFEEIER